jgi:phage prohead protease, HK97 family|nr:MAG TPA: repressor protein [Caudoviricetes sp.]
MLRKVIKSMTTAFERIKDLADKHRISLNDLEDKLGISRNSLYGIKKANPKSDRLQEIADYFNVSTDYLLGRTDNPAIASDDTIAGYTSDDLRKMAENAKTFDGKPLTDDDIDAIQNIIEIYLRGR